MTEARKVVEFLLETTKRDDVPGRLRKIVVAHIIKGNRLGDEIRAVTVPDEPDEDWATTTATKIVDHAAGEAIALRSGVQRYAVQALFENDDKPHGRLVFTVSGPTEDDDKIDTEGPDETGLVSMSMAQTRFFAELHSRNSTYRERSLVEENQQLRRENADLRGEAQKRFKLMEDLASQKHQRDLELMREVGTQKRFDRGAETLELMVPFAVNHFTGRKLLPETAPEALLIKSLADKITKDQFTQVAGVLGPELSATLWHLMSMVSKPAPEAAPATPSASLTERLAHLTSEQPRSNGVSP